MKRSTAVVLVLSGAMLGGCNRRTEQPSPEARLRNPQVVTNDTYIEGRGYYHSPFHGWYPYPYNYYSPGVGYYRGGTYYPEPDLATARPTYPGRYINNAGSMHTAEAVNRGGFTRPGSSSRSSGWNWGGGGS